ncbi:MAG: hypothetical protein ACLPY5_02800 [Candidatus Bathyarchaeia archaeon]
MCRFEERQNIPSWGLPEPFKQHIAKLNEIGVWLLRRGFYSDAQAIHEVRYQLTIDRQSLRKKRLHKGSPLFEIAICSIARGQHPEAIISLLAAFVEDILSESDKYSVELSRPAYTILTNTAWGYGLPQNLLETLNHFTVRSRCKRDPRLIVTKFLGQYKITHLERSPMIQQTSVPNLPSLTFNTYTSSSLPGSREKRVFIGGTHGNYVVIGLIENIVNELGYQPIIANQFIQDENVIDKDHCFNLLRNSAFALFEVSVPNGWQVEVEHASGKGIPLLCLFQGAKPSRHISSMIKGYQNVGWKTYDDLKDTIKEFLQDPTSRLHGLMRLSTYPPA